jgi:hypothetical protein
MTVVPPGLIVMTVMSPELPVVLLAAVVTAGADGVSVVGMTALVPVDNGVIVLVVRDDFGLVLLRGGGLVMVLDDDFEMSAGEVIGSTGDWLIGLVVCGTISLSGIISERDDADVDGDGSAVEGLVGRELAVGIDTGAEGNGVLWAKGNGVLWAEGNGVLWSEGNGVLWGGGSGALGGGCGAAKGPLCGSFCRYAMAMPMTGSSPPFDPIMASCLLVL